MLRFSLESIRRLEHYMGATLIGDISVFKHIDSKDRPKESLFVFTSTAEKNCYPHNYKWRVEFIGTRELFEKQYIPDMAHYFDDGCCQSSSFHNGEEITSGLMKLADSATALTLDIFSSYAIYGFSWPEEYMKWLSNKDHLKTFTYYLGTRHAMKIDTKQDIDQLVIDVAEVLASRTKSYVPLRCLWPLNNVQVDVLSKVDSGHSFDVF